MKKIFDVRHLRKDFGPNSILSGIFLSLFEGECLGILGGSGSGKSVLLKTLVGLIPISGGEIHFYDQRVDQLTEKEWMGFRRNVAYIFQSNALFDSETIFNNVAFPLWEHENLSSPEVKSKVESILSELGLKEKYDHFPHEFSGGMQKRVALARALIMRPQVILLDEPTAGLDPKNTLNMARIILQLKEQGISFLLVTHDIPFAIDCCDRILILQEGKIMHEGNPKELSSPQEWILQRLLKDNSNGTN